MRPHFLLIVPILITSLWGCYTMQPPKRITQKATVKIDKDGLITESKSIPQMDTITFTYEGELKSIPIGKPFILFMDNVDIANMTLSAEIIGENQKGGGSINVQLVKRSSMSIKNVKLSEKCETQTVYGSILPQIEIENGGKEQVVLTPIVNKNCNIIGYQIRNGSQEHKCEEEAKAVFEKWKKCYDEVWFPKKKGTKPPPAPPDDIDIFIAVTTTQ